MSGGRGERVFLRSPRAQPGGPAPTLLLLLLLVFLSLLRVKLFAVSPLFICPGLLGSSCLLSSSSVSRRSSAAVSSPFPSFTDEEQQETFPFLVSDSFSKKRRRGFSVEPRTFGPVLFTLALRFETAVRGRVYFTQG